MVNALTQIEDIKGAKADAKSGKVVIKHTHESTVDEAKRLIVDIGFEVKA